MKKAGALPTDKLSLPLPPRRRTGCLEPILLTPLPHPLPGKARAMPAKDRTHAWVTDSGGPQSSGGAHREVWVWRWPRCGIIVRCCRSNGGGAAREWQGDAHSPHIWALRGGGGMPHVLVVRGAPLRDGSPGEVEAADSDANGRLAAARRWALHARLRPIRILLGLVYLFGGFTGLLALAGPIWDLYACCRVQSATTFDSGGCSLPCDYKVVVPVSSCTISPISRKPWEGCIRETTMVSSPIEVACACGRQVWWWRPFVLAGLLCNADRPMVVDGVFQEKSSSARPTPTWYSLRVRPFLPGGHPDYPWYTSFAVPW
jgi:hypothetical protein